MRDSLAARLEQVLPVSARVAAMYAAMFFVTGLVTPYLPSWLAQRGFAAGEIGLLLALPPLVRAGLAPTVGWYADRAGAHRATIIGLAVLGLASWLLLWHSAGLAGALVALTLIAVAGTMTPLVEAIAMSAVRTAGHDYGRMRTWGSASFVAANLIGGVVASRWGMAPLIGLMTAGALATLAVGLVQPQPAEMSRQCPPRRRFDWSEAARLLAIPPLPLVLLAGGTLQGAHGMYYAFGTLHWQQLGLSKEWFGPLWAIGLLTELALFWWSVPIVAWLGAERLLVVGAAVSILRWSAMSIDPPLPLLVALQMLHGITFGASHLGVMHLLARIAPTGLTATAQALYAFVSTIGVVLATALSSRLFPVLGGSAYLLMAAEALVGLVAAVAILRTVQRGSPHSDLRARL